MTTATGELASRDDRLDAIIVELLDAVQRGQPLDPSPYLERHPDLAVELRQFVEDWRHFHAQSLAMTSDSGHPRAASPAPVLPRIGNYEIVERIARGGMGIVYKARQLPVRRIVALKMLSGGPSSTPDQIRRFQAEAEAVATLDHPGIVPIYEVGQQDDLPYFSMRYVAGDNLAAVVARGPLDARQAARIVRQIAVALEYAHQHQVVHRDLKPSNVLLDWSDGTALEHAQPCITDFGLAKRLASGDSFTHTGQILGTPSYMAPEQVAGPSSTVGPASDIYSLGSILYCLLTGRPPFQSADPLETLRQVREDDVIPPSRLNPVVPRDLATICLKCLEKLPERRFQRAGELVAELDRFQQGRPIVTRPIGSWERLGRWVRRQPLVATLVAAIVVAVSLEIATSAYFGLQASRQAASERERRRDVERFLYRSLVLQADLEWQADNINRADELLDACDVTLRNWEWYYLKRRAHTERLTCRGHESSVRQVDCSPDGHRIVSAGADATVRLWDAATGRMLEVWRCDAAAVAVEWSPDGTLIAAGLDDGQVVVWDAANGHQRFARQAHAGGTNRVAFHPDSQRLATCGEDGQTLLLDPRDGAVMRSWSSGSGALISLAIDPRGQVLAVGGEMNPGETTADIQIWNLESGELVGQLTSEWSIHRLAFSLDGSRLLAADSLDSIHVWDWRARAIVLDFDQHGTAVRSLVVSPDGTAVVSGDKDGTIIHWELATGRRLRSWKAHHLLVFGLSLRPHSSEVVSCGIDGLIKVWDLSAPEFVPSTSGHGDRVHEVAFSPDGQWVASASKDRTVRINAAATGETRAVCIGHQGSVLAVAFARRGDWLVSADESGQLIRWDARTGQRLEMIDGGTQEIWSVDVDPGATHLAFGRSDGTVCLWNVVDHKSVWEKSAHVGTVKCVRFDPHQAQLATSGDDGRIRLWSVAEGRVEQELDRLPGPVWNVAFSSNGRQLAGTANDGTASVWDLSAEPRMAAKLRGHTGIVYAAAFMPDGTRLVTAGFDHTVKVWDLSAAVDVLTLREAHWSVNSVAISPDGRTIAGGSSDWRVHLWRAPLPLERPH